MKDRTLRLKAVIVVLAIILVMSVGFVVLRYVDKHSGQYSGDKEILQDTVKYNGVEYALKDNIETFLVIGLDKYEGELPADSYNNNQQADFLLLLIFDNEQKKCRAIQINRDTMTEVNVLGVAGERIGTVTKQITLSHTYGNGRDVSCRNTADAVSGLLKGMKISHYISMTMDSVGILNDLVGGVELTVLNDFTGIDDTLVEGNAVKLTGQQALTYVRTRSGLEDSTNMARMARQKQYLNALYDKICESIKNDENFVIDATAQISDYIISDRSAAQLQRLMKKYNEYELIEISGIEGRSVVGEKYMEFYPDDDSLVKTVIDCFYEKKNKIGR